MSNKVSIATTPLVYSTFRFLSNKVWNALAEYVDNSIQSFLNHRELLASINPNQKLRVDIDIDFDAGTITILDNAFGIDTDNFERAFELANIPLDASGLNEFGMGMKVSSIWLSNLWSVETSSYGEPIKKKVIFDLQQVIDNQMLELNVEEVPDVVDAHYTKVTLISLSQNKPGKKQLRSIKKHLASIYTKFIREGIIDLYVNDERMVYEPLKVLNAPYYKTPNGESIEWIKKLDFKFGDRYSVKGFIALLDKMSTSTDNGLILFRRGRAIDSSGDEKYRPTLLCGEVGSPRYKRVFGELELEGFDVSFNKGTFLQDEDFDEFIASLREDLVNPQFDIFGQAQHYTKPIDTPSRKTIASNLGRAFSGATVNTNSVATVSSETNNAVNNENQTTSNQPAPQDTVSSASSHDDVVLYDNVIDMNIDGTTFKLRLRAVESASPEGLYTLELSEDDPDLYISSVNLKNPFFETFASLLSEDKITPVVKMIQTMVSAEVMLNKIGQGSSAQYFRQKFNSYFGKF